MSRASSSIRSAMAGPPRRVNFVARGCGLRVEFHWKWGTEPARRSLHRMVRSRLHDVGGQSRSGLGVNFQRLASCGSTGSKLCSVIR
jgi:hypothetical protein